jgi:hypothetical protein
MDGKYGKARNQPKLKTKPKQLICLQEDPAKMKVDSGLQ